jgi:hypothetical protein
MPKTNFNAVEFAKFAADVENADAGVILDSIERNVRILMARGTMAEASRQEAAGRPIDLRAGQLKTLNVITEAFADLLSSVAQRIDSVSPAETVTN